MESESKLRIGFSHNYPKLHNQTKATLLDARIVKRCDISEKGYRYDAEYVDRKTGDRCLYPLDEEEYIRLIFIGCDGIPFTTYRSVKPSSQEKYFTNISKEFDVYVTHD